MTRFVFSLLSILLIASPALQAGSEWKPPENPDPRRIFEDALEDGRAKRYADSLEKLEWIHRNALKFKGHFYVLRISNSLNTWGYLAKVYPPALKRLKTLQAETAEAVINRKERKELFDDFQVINRALNEHEKTAEMFVRFDAEKPEVAKEIFLLAKPALIMTKRYKLCGRYLDPETEFQTHRTTLRMFLERKVPEFENSGKRIFSREVALSVAMLTLSDRKEEADWIARKGIGGIEDAGV